MDTEQLCSQGLESVQNKLTDSEYAECQDLNYHGEWLLAHEFAVDFMSEREGTIDAATFTLFEATFLQIDQGETAV